MLMKKELNRLIALVTSRVRENNMKNHFKYSILITLTILIALPFAYIKPAHAFSNQEVPVAIGTAPQYSPFESEATVQNTTSTNPDIYSPKSFLVSTSPAITVPSASAVYDGDTSTSTTIGFPSAVSTTATGYIDLFSFPTDPAAPPITSVDVLVRYSWTGATTGSYSLYIYIGTPGTVTPSASTTIQTFTSTGFTLATKTVTGIARPGGGSWSWSDIGSLVFRNAMRHIATGTPPAFTEYEVWIIVHFTGIGSPQAYSSQGLTMANDGSINTFAQVEGFYYFNGSVGLSSWSSAPSLFPIKWVDLKLIYNFPTGANPSSMYRIQYVINGSAPVVLVAPTSGATPTTGSNTLAIPFANITNPRTGNHAWTWADITWLDLQFAFNISGTTPNKYQINEAWLTVYPTVEEDGVTQVPYPLSGTTESVQPHLIMNTSGAFTVGTYLFVDIYVFNVVKMWGYTVVLHFDPTIINAVTTPPIGTDTYNGSYTYYPWNTAGVNPAYNNTNVAGGGYVALTYYTFPSDPNGFTGSSPICRIYFKVVGGGSSTLHFTTMDLSDPLAAPIVHTTYDGYFNMAPPPVPEFPLGVGIIMLVAPLVALAYIWRTRKRKVR